MIETALFLKQLYDKSKALDVLTKDGLYDVIESVGDLHHKAALKTIADAAISTRPERELVIALGQLREAYEMLYASAIKVSPAILRNRDAAFEGAYRTAALIAIIYLILKEAKLCRKFLTLASECYTEVENQTLSRIYSPPFGNRESLGAMKARFVRMRSSGCAGIMAHLTDVAMILNSLGLESDQVNGDWSLSPLPPRPWRGFWHNHILKQYVFDSSSVLSSQLKHIGTFERTNVPLLNLYAAEDDFASKREPRLATVTKPAIVMRWKGFVFTHKRYALMAGDSLFLLPTADSWALEHYARRNVDLENLLKE